MVHKGMTPDAAFFMKKTGAGNLFHFWNNANKSLRLDWNLVKDNSVDNRAKQAIAIVVLVLGIAGATPLITAVHGQQQPRTPLEYEVQDARDRISHIEATMQNLPVLIAAMAEHQKLEDQVTEEHYKQEQAFESHVLYGLLGLGGSALLAIFAWVLGHFVRIGNAIGGQHHVEEEV